METFACLLRGINVGGNNIIPMAKLVKTFERVGHTDVKTLIASGNVVFRAKRADVRALERKLEAALVADYAYDAKVVVKSSAEIAAIAAALPRGWKTPSVDQRYYVMFLRHTIDHAKLLDSLAPAAGVEWLDYAPGVLFWRAIKTQLGKSKVAKLPAALYADMTARNLNTTLKLAQMVAAHTQRPPA